jgi:methylisocitrate lyase
LPVLADADAGFGEPMNVARARTDIRAVDVLEATIERARRLVDASAHAVFPDALQSLDEFAVIRSAIAVPMLANMTEFGKSELFTVDQLRDVGMNIVIWPVSLLRMAMGAAERALETLKTAGSLTSRLGQMQHRRDLYDLVDYASYNRFDESAFNFRVAD